MTLPRGETAADGYDVVNAGRTPKSPPGRRDWRNCHVCRAILPPASPGAISTNCQNPPVNDLGFCADHAA